MPPPMPEEGPAPTLLAARSRIGIHRRMLLRRGSGASAGMQAVQRSKMNGTIEDAACGVSEQLLMPAPAMNIFVAGFLSGPGPKNFEKHSHQPQLLGASQDRIQKKQPHS